MISVDYIMNALKHFKVRLPFFDTPCIIMASKYYQDWQSSKISELTQLARKLISLTTFIDSKMKQMINHNELVEDLKFTKIVKRLSEHDVYFASLFASTMRCYDTHELMPVMRLIQVTEFSDL